MLPVVPFCLGFLVCMALLPRASPPPGPELASAPAPAPAAAPLSLGARMGEPQPSQESNPAQPPSSAPRKKVLAVVGVQVRWHGVGMGAEGSGAWDRGCGVYTSGCHQR